MRQISPFASTVFPDCIISRMSPTRTEGKVCVSEKYCTYYTHTENYKEEADVKKNE